MRLIIIIISRMLCGCLTKQQNGKNISTEIVLPQDKEINIDYQVYDVCSTYYYNSNDSLNPLLTRVVSKDEKGRDKEIIYRYFESYVPATSLIIYDSLDRKVIEYNRLDEKGLHSSLTKAFHYYDEKGQLDQSVYFDFERRIRKDADKGLGRSGGCVVTEDDYESNKSWKLSSIWNYKYDAQGKLIEMLAPVINSSQNRYLYQYDAKGRLLEERSLDGQRLIWIEKYNYGQNGYEFTRTWFENDGTKRKETDGSFVSVDTFRYKTDKFNNVTQKMVLEEGGKMVSKDNKFYDNRNRLIKHEIFNDSNKLLGYYFYKYNIAKKPALRNFFVDSK